MNYLTSLNLIFLHTSEYVYMYMIIGHYSTIHFILDFWTKLYSEILTLIQYNVLSFLFEFVLSSSCVISCNFNLNILFELLENAKHQSF